MFHSRMSVSTAETLSSFLTVAAERFKEDAALCRAEGAKALAPPPADLPPGVIWCPPHPGSMESLAKQFDKQERQARQLAEQFAEAYANPGSWVVIPEAA
jgi:hypothetical protein